MIPFFFFQKNEKGMYKSESVFCFKAKGINAISEFRFSFCHGKEKGNMPCEVDFSFLGRSKDDEIS